MISDLAQPHPNILRYEKLRMLMGLNLKQSWEAVEQLAAVACYTCNDDFDNYLDSLTTEKAIQRLIGITDGPK